MTKGDTSATKFTPTQIAFWANLNAGLWGVGNGLASTSLAIYLAIELGAPSLGLSIGMLLAAPHFVGLLRFFSPVLIGRLSNRKTFCLGAYASSAALLITIPLLAAPERYGSVTWSLFVLVLLWCLYHLFEYVGTIALWSWLADLVPLEHRGDFLGKRQQWLIAGQMGAMLCAASFALLWNAWLPEQPRWHQYACLGISGAVVMFAAIWPLAKLPQIDTPSSQPVLLNSRNLWAPLFDKRFLRFLLFGCWFSFANGFTQSAQRVYFANELHFSLGILLVFRVGMQMGQVGVSPYAGNSSDRVGNRPILIVGQLLVAGGLLFYWLATPQQPWWVSGAWILWVAYALLNVCLPNLLLKLADADANAPYIAIYYALGSVCYASSTLAGGYLVDRVRDGTLSADWYSWLFLFGWLLRTAGVLWLLAVIEPGAKRVRDLFSKH